MLLENVAGKMGVTKAMGHDSIARRLQDIGAFDLVMRARNAKAFTKGCPAVWALEMGDPSAMHHWCVPG